MTAGMSKSYTVENHGLGVKNGAEVYCHVLVMLLKQTRLVGSVDGALENIIV